jgi:acyl carrier protein
MDKLEIQEKLFEILCKHTDLDKRSVTPESHLKFDLGLDSLDVAEIVYEIEEVFGISIADTAAEKIQKVSETVDFIHEKLTEQPQEGLSPQG